MRKAYQLILKCFAIAVLAALPFTFYGQEEGEAESTKSSSFSPYWYLKASFGASFDHSDLNRYKMAPDFEMIQPAGQIGFGRQFTPVVGFGGYFNRGFLEAQEPDLNLTYKGDYFEFAFRAPINFSNLFAGYKDRKFNIWGSIGYGQIQYKSNIYNHKTGAPLFTLGYEDSSPPDNAVGNGLADRRVVAILPVGIGFSYAIAEKWDLNLDYTFKFADSDIVDGHVAGAEAIKQDMFSYTGIGVTYKIGAGASLNKMQKDFDQITLKTTPEVLVEKGEMVEVTIEGTFPPKYFNSKAAMLFQPVLKYEDGGEYVLKPMTLKGEDVVGEGTVINSKTGGTFTYTDKFPYEQGMNASELVVDPVAYIVKETIHESKDAITINEKFVELGERKLADGVIYTSERIYPGEAALIAGHHGYKKETIISEMSKIYFRVNLYNLNWRLPLNKKEATLDKLENMWNFVERGWDIKNVEIDGWASPEGEETFNENLSENRAKTAYNYMTGKFKRISWKKDATVDYKNPEEQISFMIKHHGPDWAGFMNAVESSDMKDKNVILNVIRSAGSQSKKEQEIRNMILIYPELEDDILKPLRRAEMTVNCYEPKRTDENIAELSTTYPDSLKIEELLYAATLTEDDGTQIDIYESVIEIYPDDWKAYNNYAVIALEHGNVEKAAGLLEDAMELAPNNGKIYNNMGVIALHAGDYEDAEEMFKKAESLGENANYNLGLIAIHKGDYDKAMKLMGGKDCDYNTGLAQLVADDYSKAENTLKCAKENVGEAYYLLAIIGAKTDNSSMMYEYLTKAIKENDAYKAQAKHDREFIEYFDAPDFQALVQ
ncbi:MAG: tetratricopeptide repeat protein [Bacteroidales bacterium]|nr:tetratricopeptide repeat protein [Bacteroidales bacterium]MCF8387311.1 tetratricopeptide repeat protein [Bacteroidales bacterium]MCF8397965.1 tetratricopeptide repeat protein [Bacteroidales bacterium]